VDGHTSCGSDDGDSECVFVCWSVAVLTDWVMIVFVCGNVFTDRVLSRCDRVAAELCHRCCVVRRVIWHARRVLTRADETILRPL